MEPTTRLLIGMTAIAMNMPSAYTISWSKKEHPESTGYLYGGLGITALTLVAAMTDQEKLLWLGLGLSFLFFLYVALKE